MKGIHGLIPSHIGGSGGKADDVTGRTSAASAGGGGCLALAAHTWELSRSLGFARPPGERKEHSQTRAPGPLPATAPSMGGLSP